MTSIDKGFKAHQIKEIRELLGMSRMEFAHELGVHHSTIVRWELGSSKASKLATKFIGSLV